MISPGAAWRRQAVVVLVGFVMAMTAPIELLYAIKLGLGPGLVTVFIVVASLAASAIDTFGTLVLTRLDARAMMGVALTAFAISEACYGASGDALTLIGARVLQGLASALMAGGILQMTVRVATSTTRAVGSVQSLQLIGGAFGAPFGGYLAGTMPGLEGYRLAFGVGCGSGLLVACLVGALLPSLPPADRARPRVSLPRLAVPATARLVLALGLFGNYLRSGLENTGLPLVGDARGLSAAEIGLALGVLSAVEIVVLAVSGRLFERLGAARCLTAALVLGLGAVALLATAHDPAGFLAAAAVLGVVDGIALAAPPVLLIELTDDPSLAVATYRIMCGVGSLGGSSSVNLLVALLGPLGALAIIGVLLAGGVGLAHRVSSREMEHEIKRAVAQ